MQDQIRHRFLRIGHEDRFAGGGKSQFRFQSFRRFPPGDRDRSVRRCHRAGSVIHAAGIGAEPERAVTRREGRDPEDV